MQNLDVVPQNWENSRSGKYFLALIPDNIMSKFAQNSKQKNSEFYIKIDHKWNDCS
jgi:hypothetical protein